MPSSSSLPGSGASVGATASPSKRNRVTITIGSVNKYLLEKFASNMAEQLAFHKYNIMGPRRVPEMQDKSDKWVYRRAIEFSTAASDVNTFIENVHHLPDFQVTVQIVPEDENGNTIA